MSAMFKFFHTVHHFRYLIFQMIRREVSQRYQGSALGFAWSFLNPLLMLVVYTFVFSVVFKARWSGGDVAESRTDFALTLFAGLIVFNVFSEIINKAPGLVLSNVNFVKKVVFPLEILPLVSIGAVLFHGFVSLLVLLLAQLILNGHIPSTVLIFPLILLPLLAMGLGASWFLASITVYIRDVAYITSIITTMLMFLSAVFFPVSALPEEYRVFIYLNPVAVIVSESRNALIFGLSPNWVALGGVSLVGLTVAVAGYWWFQKTRKGFADVL